MSMSQEEIESLMNGLDFGEDNSNGEVSEKNETPEKSMSEDDINELISQTEEIINDKESTSDTTEKENVEKKEDISDEFSFENNEQNVDDILNEIEAIPNEEKESLEEDNNIDDILASIDGIKDEPVVEENSFESVSENITSEKNEEDLDHKINSGVFPLPVEQDTKVVNQLSQVANDSEEKASKIFDVLSNILDYNNNIQGDVQELATFNEKQTAMLTSLNNKFPNIEVFKQNLEQAQKMGNFISDINGKLENGNMEIFQAMELMQFHDINRQKIERVMSVIRKLSVYLNNLFEDEGEHKEIAVAKHIHGDSSTSDLVGDDDLEALIAEFNK